MDKPKISIIVPIYNQEKYVGKCIRSILCQSFQDFEVILVNDGSTDKSLRICQKYAQKDERISIINKQNEGVALARKDGVMRARGEYLSFLDSDDYLAPNAMELLYEIVLKKNVDVAIGSYDTVYDNWELLKKKSTSFGILDAEIPKDQIIPCIVGNNGSFEDRWCGYMWGRLYRRLCVLKAQRESKYPLYPEGRKTVIEDTSFNCVLAPYIGSLWISSEVVLHYRYGGITSGNFAPIRNSSSCFDDRVEYCFLYHCESVLPRVLNHYSVLLKDDVCHQYHYQISSEQKIHEFVEKELNHRKIVLWARQHIVELPDKMRNDILIQSVLNCDVDAFLDNAKEREKFLRKHHYWKMKIVKVYMMIVNAISGT